MNRVASAALASLMSAAAVLVSLAWLHEPEAPPSPVPPSFMGNVAVDAAADGPIAAGDLRGLWTRYVDGSGREDQPVAFYYFHDGGIGLFRYGRLGSNTTNSYNWVVGEHGGQPMLVLTYRKTGEVQHLPIHIERDGRRTLIIDNDPKNPGAGQSRYVFVPPPSLATMAPDLELTPMAAADGEVGIDDRLWIDQRKFATGGMGFQLYQFRKAGIDGRGTGWHHVGDYDDWSTESISYRILRGEKGPKAIDLTFTLRGERHTTPVTMGTRNGKRVLQMGSDPRDFWAAHTFADGGPSFAARIARAALVWMH